MKTMFKELIHVNFKPLKLPTFRNFFNKYEIIIIKFLFAQRIVIYLLEMFMIIINIVLKT